MPWPLERKSTRSGKSAAARAELEKLEELVREGYRGITALRSSVITDWQRREVFSAYGWTGGLLGKFPDSRVISLARMGARDQEQLAPEFRYAPGLIADLRTTLAVFDAVEPETTTGGREAAIRQRNLALSAAMETLSQVRHSYCAASREGAKTKELARIGFQPRRDRRTPEAIAIANEKIKTRRETADKRKQERLVNKQAEDLSKAQARLDRLKAEIEATNHSVQRLSGTTPVSGTSSPADGDVTLSS